MTRKTNRREFVQVAGLAASGLMATAGSQAAAIGKKRLVADRGGPLQQLIRIQPDGDDEDNQDRADESGANELRSTVFKHRVPRTSR